MYVQASKDVLSNAVSEVSRSNVGTIGTRFATEVILRRSDKLSIAVSIGSGIGRPAEERHKDFAKRVKSKDEFPAIFESARAAMGLTHSGQAFSDHILRIEIRGPTYPQLTIVDLPGLIHTETKTQTVEDVELVSKLVRDYMINPKSIILAVVSAKNDIANQIVLQKAREIDPEGLRTLGIITKPDQLYPSSHNEESFLELARNEQVKFKLGWHVVKNQDLSSGSYIAENRDTEEAEYVSRRRVYYNICIHYLDLGTRVYIHIHLYCKSCDRITHFTYPLSHSYLLITTSTVRLMIPMDLLCPT